MRNINSVQETLIKLLSTSIRGLSPDAVNLSPDDCQALYNEAVAHQVHLIIYHPYKKLMRENDINTNLSQLWKNTYYISTLKYKTSLMGIKDVLHSFNKSDIPVMVLKGLYYRDLYPYPETRIMGDIDLLIKPEHLNDSIYILLNLGYTKTDDEHSPLHIGFYHDKFINLELHFSLTDVKKREIASALNSDIWIDCHKYLFDDAVSYLIPSGINNIVYCCIHMTNHLVKGGFGLRQLVDFVLLIENEGESLDWNELFKTASKYSIEVFIKALLGICNKYLSLNIPSDIQNELSSYEEYLDLLLDTIFISGVFGRKSDEWYSNKSLSTYITPNTSDSVNILRFFFPPRNKLNRRYSYAQKSVFLLPVAWFHRLINNLLRKDLRLSEKIPNSKVISNNAKLMDWLNIK